MCHQDNIFVRKLCDETVKVLADKGNYCAGYENFSLNEQEKIISFSVNQNIA